MLAFLWILLTGLAGILLFRSLLEPRLPQIEYWRLHPHASTGCHTWGELQNTLLCPTTKDATKLSQEQFETSTEQGLRILWLTDLHADAFSLSETSWKRLLKPMLDRIDLCLFGGDLSNGMRGKAKGIQVLRSLSTLCQTYHIPCYAVAGNHDWLLSASDWEETGFVLLKNQSIWLTHSHNTIQLSGLEDLRRGCPLPPKRCQRPAQGTEESGPYPSTHIVIGHNPDLVFSLSPEEVDAFLCGHFHGGQIRLPFHLEFRLLRPERLSQMGVRSGPFLCNGILSYVSRGMGCVLFPFRLGSRPECTVLLLPLSEARKTDDSADPAHPSTPNAI